MDFPYKFWTPIADPGRAPATTTSPSGPRAAALDREGDEAAAERSREQMALLFGDAGADERAAERPARPTQRSLFCKAPASRVAENVYS